MLEAQVYSNLSEKPSAQPSAQLTLLKEQLYLFHAYHLGEGLKLKEIAKGFDLKPALLHPNCLIYELSPESYLLFYNFGSVVFFNVPEAAHPNTLQRIKPPVASDEFLLEVEPQAQPKVSFDKVVLATLSREKIEILSLILAQSTALDHFEKKVDEILGSLGGFLSELGKRKRIREKKIIQLIEKAMTTKQELIATLCLLEKPDETWEDKSLDDLHQEAEMMFELKDRFRILDYKLKTIQENLEILSNFVTNRQHLFLEGTIVALIVVEVVLFCYDLFIH